VCTDEKVAGFAQNSVAAAEDETSGGKSEMQKASKFVVAVALVIG